MEKGRYLSPCQNLNPPWAHSPFPSTLIQWVMYLKKLKMVRHQWYQHSSLWSHYMKCHASWNDCSVLPNRVTADGWLITNRHWRRDIKISKNTCSFDASFIITNLTSEVFWTIWGIKNDRKKYNKRACSWHPGHDAAGQLVTPDRPKWHNPQLFLSFSIILSP